MSIEAMHECLAHFPGAALELSSDGVVQASNGHLDALVGQDLPGQPLAEVLEESSLAKWQRILSEPERLSPACTWELGLRTPTSLELRTFLAIWGGPEPDARLWLLEYSPDPKLELLYGELSALHTELASAQRTLARERNRLAHALEQAEAAVRARDQVLAIVSHDLRNPLSTILMAAGVLEMPIPEEQKARQIEIIHGTAARMNRLIEDLLDVSAIEAGQFRIEKVRVPLAPLLRESCNAFALQAAQSQQELQCQVAADLPEIRGDAGRLQQALANLLGNALKFTPPGGWIRLEARQSEREIVVSVEDSGPGIPEQELPHIFDRFWQARRSRHGGAGLGLAITKGIIDGHGGRIWVESEPGEGTKVSFALPLGEGAE